MRPIFLTATILLALTPAASRAQMALPGAVANPTPAGQSAKPPVPQKRKSPVGAAESDSHFTPAKPPALETIVAKNFVLGGSRGGLTVEKLGGDLSLSRLILTGDKISHPNQPCEVAMGGDEPLKLKPLGAPDGAPRFELLSSACPLQFDVLNGALLATSPSGACSFAQADCRVDAAGLWGPPGDSFGVAQAKAIERERTGLEKSVRAHFRALLAKLKKDKAATRAAVQEQAGFSSLRSQTCRDYQLEEKHGFCALRLTEARDYRLQTRLAEVIAAKAEKKKKAAAKLGRVVAPAPHAPGAK